MYVHDVQSTRKGLNRTHEFKTKGKGLQKLPPVVCGVKLEYEELCTSASAVPESNLRIRAQTAQLFLRLNSSTSDKHSKLGEKPSRAYAVADFVTQLAVKSSSQRSLEAEAEQLDEAED